MVLFKNSEIIAFKPGLQCVQASIPEVKQYDNKSPQ